MNFSVFNLFRCQFTTSERIQGMQKVVLEPKQQFRIIWCCVRYVLIFSCVFGTGVGTGGGGGGGRRGVGPLWTEAPQSFLVIICLTYAPLQMYWHPVNACADGKAGNFV